jgi:ammonium transporter, Amt family
MFAFAFAFFKIQNALMKGGIRPTEADEIAGLDLPEMGVLAYPEFDMIAAEVLAEHGNGSTPTEEEEPEATPV